MYHHLYKVTAFALTGHYTLRIAFDDGSEQVVDLEPILYGEMYGPLRDPAIFQQVTLDPDAKTLVWPNGADFDPETLRNWPQYKDDLAKRAKRWAQVTA